MNRDTVLVTGGAGFIGSHTVDLLLSEGYKVRVLDNLSKPVHRGDKSWPGYLSVKAEKVLGSVTSFKDWKKALNGVDFVIHLAAYQDLLPKFSTFFSTNTVGTSLLYEVIVKENFPIKKVVVASSQFVYGEGKYKCERDGVVYPKGRSLESLSKGLWDPVCPECGGFVKHLQLTEDHSDPRNQYSISKYSQELIGLRLGKLHNIPTTAFRYSIVQGDRQSYRNAYSGVLRLFTLSMMQGRSPTIFEDGLQLRDYVNVKDVAKANVLALKEKRSDFEVYNVGGGRAYTVLNFAKIVANIVGFKGEFKIPGEFRLGDTRHSVSDISKLKSLGWAPVVKIQQSVSDYVKWIKEQKLEKDYALEADKKLRKLGTVRKSNKV